MRHMNLSDWLGLIMVVEESLILIVLYLDSKPTRNLITKFINKIK